MKLFFILLLVLNCNVSLAQKDQNEVKYDVANERMYVQTNYGDFVIRLHSQEAPKTTEQIKIMVRMGLYNGVEISSVSPDYYIQIDDVRNKLAPSTLEQESILKPIDFEDSGFSHQRGAVSLTLDAEGKAGESALTILTGSSEEFDNKQTVVGEVEQGMNLLSVIDKLKTDKDNFLIKPVRIYSIILLPSEQALQRFKENSKAVSSLPMISYSKYAFAFIVIFAFISFLLFGKINQRSHMAFTMIMAFIAIFSNLILMDQMAKSSSFGGLIMFASFIALYKFLNRFESQKS